ncbi:MAG: TerB family tellurite resistance protein [Deltaproteobacteria bacterium]|nr:TerB family tellurite resistance protein [Deltaproteobacteria bacterium]
MREHIDTITDLLLGAAYADKRLEGQELAAIRSMVSKLMGTPAPPAAQEERIKSFNPAKHDAGDAARSLAALPMASKRKLIGLVASVTESDDEIDFAEDAYLRTVAEGLGLAEDEIAALTIEIIETDELDGFLDES